MLIKHFIERIKNKEVKNFFWVAFSETVRESSITRKGEFKLIRMSEKKRLGFDPDSFKLMLSKLIRNKIGLSRYMEQKNNRSSTHVYSFNTVEIIPDNILPKDSVDIVITSPPYGDSRTTVAYGQYSRLSSQWMGITHASSIDKTLMGGTKYNSHFALPSDYLNDLLIEIDKKDTKKKIRG